MNTLAERIKSTRINKAWTQNDLASAAKVSQSLIHKLESGNALESRKIAAIAFVLGVNTDWLAKGIGEQYRGNHLGYQKQIDECKATIDRIIEIAQEAIAASRQNLGDTERMRIYKAAILLQLDLQIGHDDLRKHLAMMLKK